MTPSLGSALFDRNHIERVVARAMETSEPPKTRKEPQPSMDHPRRCRLEPRSHHSPARLRLLITTSRTSTIEHGVCAASWHADRRHNTGPVLTPSATSRCSAQTIALSATPLGKELATLLVGRPYPSRSLFATVTDSKGGEDTAAFHRMSSFSKESGILKFVYKTDQEASIKVMVGDALRRTGKSRVFEA